ncbi:MAG: peroxiredoxin [bacterium]|jgi:peroxiredoxin
MKLLILSLTALACFAACTTNSATTKDQSQSDTTVVAQTEAALQSGYAVGDEATDFSLPSTQGKRVSLGDYPEAKGFIVIFTCNHCPYAVAYEQRIIDLNKKYAPLGYPVIAVSPNDTTIVPDDGLVAMTKRAKEKGFSFPYLLDEDQSIYPQYGATKTPHIFILNKQEGKNIVRYIGAIDNNYADPNDVSERYAEDALDALLAGKIITTTSTKAIGCSIKDKRNKKH